jgi:excisionase family DNA binding protein
MEKGGTSGSMATELAVGLSIAQQMMQQQGFPPGAATTTATPGASALPELLSPADVAKVLSVTEQDVMAIIQSNELAAKKIGAAYRIKRSALDEYLAK